MFGHTRISIAAFLVLLLLAVGGCGKGDEESETKSESAAVESTVDGTEFRCVAEATPPTINGATQNPPRPDETATLRVYAYNGSGRYALPRTKDSSGNILTYYVTEFASSATHSGGYYNNTGTKQTRGATVEVYDIVSKKSAKCSFTVLVNPRGYGPNPNSPYPLNNFTACHIQGKDTPTTGESVVYDINVVNSPTNFTFSTLDTDMGTKATITSSGFNRGSATVSFTTAGYHKVATTILNGSSGAGYCEKILYVRNKPTVNLTASTRNSPPGHVAANEITVTAFPQYFAGPATLAFTSDKADVIITKTDNVVKVTSAIAQTVRITVTASYGSDSATAFVDLTFGTPNPGSLLCRLTHAVLTDGKTVRYQLSTVGVSQNLTVTQFSLTDGDGGSIVSNQGQTVDVLYGSAGFKTIAVKANLEGDTSKQCNSGNDIFDSLIVGNNVACSAFTSPNPSSVYGRVVVTAIPFGLALGNYRIKSVTSSSNNMTQNSTNLEGGLARELYFNAAGDYSVDVTVEDTVTNTTATCSTRQVVSNYLPQCQATFYYADDTLVSNPRIREDLYIKVTSNLYSGYINFFPGGETFNAPGIDYVTFPAKSVIPTSYKNAGFVNTTVSVQAPNSNYTTMCSVPLNIGAGLACSVTTTARKTLTVSTPITVLTNAGPYSGGSTTVAHSITTTNSKGTVNFSLSGDDLTTVSTSSTTGTYSKHGTFNVQGFVTDQRDLRGAYCNASTIIDKEQNVTIVQDVAAVTYDPNLDTASVTFSNTSGQPVRVLFTAKSGAAGTLIVQTINVPASGTIISPSILRNMANGLFDFQLKVLGDEPRTGSGLIPTVNATIKGVARAFTLGAL